MSGRVEIVARYSRAEIQANPEKLYVFGDNRAGVGRGGQAKECRGEQNVEGVLTKWTPTMLPDAFLSDADLTEVKPLIQASFRRMARHIEGGGVVVLPADGLGTGLARLPEQAPAIHAFISRCVEHLKAKYYVSHP